LFLLLFIAGNADSVKAQYSYSNKSAVYILQDLQQKTPYRFLYREALLTNITLDLRGNSEQVIQEMQDQLKNYAIEVDIDPVRKQIVLYKSDSSGQSANIRISGQVINARTGERLPFATIFWESPDGLKGVNSNEAGAFTINSTTTKSIILLNASYVGYHSDSLEINLSDKQEIKDITFRLAPSMASGDEIVVSEQGINPSINKTLQHTIDIGTFSPLGESNSIRALQNLPSVNINTAVQNGLNVRGSSADGFQVLLDGITIYNQSHLFGLLDSFNADVLQTSGLFYDITPVEYKAPPGGTLSLHTKTGSLNEFNSSVGVSNSTYRVTLEGPLKKGKSSWLISARNSYLDAVSWLNNDELIKWGLNVDRPQKVLAPNVTELESRLVEPTGSDARFFDFHGKLYVEGNAGSRFIVSGYFGRDDTEQRANRLFRRFGGIDTRPVSTTNEWGNGAAGIQYQRSFTSNLYSQTTAGFSIYETEFNKEDFTYTRVNQNDGTLRTFTLPFENESILNEFKLEQRFNFSTQKLLWTFGGSYHFYKGEYFENSFDRPGFFDRATSHQLDGYLQADFIDLPKLELFAGSRLHYYSNGDFLKLSPRIKTRLFPDAIVSVGAGYSKNYQFLNKVSLSNVTSSEVWILAGEEQPPLSVDYYSAGIYLNSFNNTSFQIEGYIKDYENVRLHEINTFSLSSTFSNLPWFAENNGLGKGIEFFLSNQFNKFSVSQSFTISSMELHNPLINEGESFFVDWDRTYSYSNTIEHRPSSAISLFLSWVYATGTPNKLAVFGPENQTRLGNYSRFDLSIEYKNRFEFGNLKAGLSFYNLLDRNNPWYRDLSFALDRRSTRQRLTTVPIEVFDLGFQPSFNIALDF